ncbi:MAG: glycosyltransferase family 2 protein [Ardenticatenaceae bacterium]
MPLISIVMPVYNGEKTIQKTIDSALQQTFTDFELIVVNDGSTDDTLEILNTIQDPRVKVISSPNRGSYPARNLGIQQAQGEFIAFLDADDLWTADKLAAQLDALQRYPKTAVAYSWTEFIDLFGHPLGGRSKITLNGDIWQDLLIENLMISGSNPMVRRQALDAVGHFDESFHTAGDWDLWIRLAKRYHFVVVPKVQVFYRRTDQAWSANLQRQEKASFRVIEKSFAGLPAAWQPLKKRAIARYSWYLARRVFEVLPSSSPRLPGRSEGWLALRALGRVLYYHPVYLRHWRACLKIFITIIATFLLPPTQIQRIREQLRALRAIGLGDHASEERTLNDK